MLHPKGFTLLELLIALSLSAIVMLLLAVGINIVLKDWERSSNRLEDTLEMALVILQIERALEGTFPHYYLQLNENKKYLFFEGKKDKVTWVSTVSPGRQAGLTAWQIRPTSKEGIEIRIVPAFVNDPTKNLDKATPITTFEHYKPIFEYLYFDEQFPKDAKWVEEWSAKKLQALPHAVRFRLERKRDDAKQATEIITFIQAYKHPMLRPLKP